MCDCGNNCANECVIPITIPTGDTGATGADSTVPGPPGTNAMVFEFYYSGIVDTIWGATATAMANLTRAVTLGAGEYMVILALNTLITEDAIGEIYIYVNNVLADTVTPISIATAAAGPNTLTLPLAFNWKGTVGAGEIIDIRAKKVSGGGGFTSASAQMQIYKVS